MNYRHLSRLVEAMYKVDDCPALDEYGSKIFGRTIRGSWRLFRHIARMAVPGDWVWIRDVELVKYPSQADVPTLEEFATMMLHEVAHGWCYFHKDNLDSNNYPTGVDEEQVCWDVSRLVCEMLGIFYREDLADLNHQFHIRRQAGDIEALERIMKQLPAHNQFSNDC